MTTHFSINFADAETPAKLGPRYVLEQTPAPPVSLQLFRNGALLANGADYQLAGPFVSPLGTWDDADVLVAFYRF